jgi:HSP20 family protein
MALIRWDPFRELETISTRLNQMFGSESPRGSGLTEGFADWSPAIDVQETDKEYLLKADLPEVKKEDVKVCVQDGVLSVEGERRQEKEEKDKKFHRVERSFGRFVRRITVPTDVDQKNLRAEFKDGVLNVHLPKSASATPRSIDVHVT